MRMPEPPSGSTASGAPVSATEDVASDHAHAGPPSANGAAASNGLAAADGSTSRPEGVDSTVAESVAAESVDAARQADPGSGLAAMNGHAEQQGGQVNGQARKWTATVTAMLTVVEDTVRRNWLASALIVAGIVMRLLVQAAYQPALVYIDTLKYLYNARPGADPVAYKIPLKMILALGGDLNTVELVQHLLGVAIAVAIYAVLVKRGTPRWLAALAMAPVLFDAYQLQVEAMIMPDVWFEALIVAGLTVLLWQKRPTLPTLLIGAALLGASTGVRQIGEVMIVPALVYAIVLGGGLHKVVVNVVSVTWAFLAAIVLYMGASYALTHQAHISNSSTGLTYGRMAAAADCATLNIPQPVRLLCPNPQQKAQGPDWLEHSDQGPAHTLEARLLVKYPNLAGDTSQVLESEFNHAVERQQPLRVIGAILRDSVKVFALTRDTSPGDTPIARWQFHGYFPVYVRFTRLVGNRLYVKLPHRPAMPLSVAYAGSRQVNVDVPIARFLRSYQVNGGYTPGPLLLLCLLAGLAGSVLLAFRRRITPAARELGLGCITFLTAAVAVLAISDAFEFSWRYQLPGIVILPAAGALGISMIMVVYRRRRAPAATQTVSERVPELAAPAQ
jgi:hypothetical protein